MELINNTTKTLKDDLSVEIKQGSKRIFAVKIGIFNLLLLLVTQAAIKSR